MFFSTAFISLLAAGASAMPHVFKRTPGAVEFCTGNNFTGACSTQNKTLNTCNDLPTGFAKNISSFGPDRGAECMLMQGHCNADEDYYSIKYPGINDLSTIHENKIPTSYICFAETESAVTKTRILSAVV